MKAYFAFPDLPKELYLAPTLETVIWVIAFVIFFGLVLWFCWKEGN